MKTISYLQSAMLAVLAITQIQSQQLNTQKFFPDYITKITSGSIFLTSNYDQVVDLRISQESTSTEISLDDIHWIE